MSFSQLPNCVPSSSALQRNRTDKSRFRVGVIVQPLSQSENLNSEHGSDFLSREIRMEDFPLSLLLAPEILKLEQEFQQFR